MATLIRRVFPGVTEIVTAHNALIAQIGAGSHFHLGVSEVTVTVANASDLPTSLVLCNYLIGVYRFHFADLLAHKVADATSLPVVGAALDLTTAIAAATLIKASHATHIASTSVNYAADSTNTLLTATPTDQTSLNTFLNAAKTAINAHMADGASTAQLREVAA